MTHNQQKKPIPYSIIVIKGSIRLIFFFIGLFMVAGSTDYWQGWVYLLFCVIQSLWLFKVFASMSDLAQERIRPGPGIKPWDKVFYAFFIPFGLATFLVPPLDVGRMHWTTPVPHVITGLGYIIYFTSNLMMVWCIRTNRFFSSVVRIQTDRGHRVVKDGPYQYVRHPGYSVGFFMFISLPLILGSYLGLIPALLTIVSMIVRTYLEDKTLQDELPGYRDYANEVKYRLWPGVW